MTAGLYKYSGLERPCFSSVQLLLTKISSPSDPIDIEDCIYVISLFTNALRSCRNFTSTIMLLWKVWELTNSALILIPPLSLSGDLNSAGTLLTFSELYCWDVMLPVLNHTLSFIFGFYVRSFCNFLTLLQSQFFIYQSVFFQNTLMICDSCLL